MGKIQRKKIYIGDVFGNLKVMKKYDKDKKGSQRWLCVCECGKKTIAEGYKLISGNTKSCGCLKIEWAKKIIRDAESHQKSMEETIKAI